MYINKELIKGAEGAGAGNPVHLHPGQLRVRLQLAPWTGRLDHARGRPLCMPDASIPVIIRIPKSMGEDLPEYGGKLKQVQSRLQCRGQHRESLSYCTQESWVGRTKSTMWLISNQTGNSIAIKPTVRTRSTSIKGTDHNFGCVCCNHNFESIIPMKKEASLQVKLTGQLSTHVPHPDDGADPKYGTLITKVCLL